MSLFAESGFYNQKVEKVVEVVVDRNKLSKNGFNRLVKTMAGVKEKMEGQGIQFMLNQRKIKESVDY